MFDVCIATFSSLKFDGRSRNLLDACARSGLSVLAVSLDEFDCDSEQVKHIRVKVPENERVAKKWWRYIREVRRLLKDERIRTFWASDLYSLPLLSVIQHERCIYDSRELYFALATLSQHSLKQKVISLIEGHYIKKADIVITTGKLDSKILREHYKLRCPIYEIFNYPPYKKYIESNLIRERLNISKDSHILLYQGAVLEGRGLMPIIKTLAAIYKDESIYGRKELDVVLVVLGSGNYVKVLKQKVNELNISDKVYFVGEIPYDELHKWTCSADVGLCNIELISLSYQMARPNKLFEYMLAELPAIVSDLPALIDIINENANALGISTGLILKDDENVDEVVDVLCKIIGNKEFYKERIRQVKRNYTYEANEGVIRKILC